MSLSPSWNNFLIDFHDLLENLVTIHPELFVLVDCNRIFDKQSTVASTCNDILAVYFSTHIHGHRLDLLITRSTTNYIHTLTATDGLSDHFTVIAETKFKHNPVDSKCNILYRYNRRICHSCI